MREWGDRIAEPTEPQPVLCDCGHWQHEVDGEPEMIKEVTFCCDCADRWHRLFDGLDGEEE